MIIYNGMEIGFQVYKIKFNLDKEFFQIQIKMIVVQKIMLISINIFKFVVFFLYLSVKCQDWRRQLFVVV